MSCFGTSADRFSASFETARAHQAHVEGELNSFGEVTAASDDAALRKCILFYVFAKGIPPFSLAIVPFHGVLAAVPVRTEPRTVFLANLYMGNPWKIHG